MALDIKNILESIKSRTSRIPAGKSVPIALYRDWRILCIAMLLLIATSLAYDVYLFMSIQNTEASSGGPNAPQQTLSRAKLQDIIDAFSAKETVFNQRKITKPSVPNL